MELDFTTLAEGDRYKILTACVTPRPIAWVTTLSAAGDPNAAPFSFFNVLGSDPPVVALGLLARGTGMKDTARNIVETGEFVVNMVDEAHGAAMSQTSVDAPPGVSELLLADVTVAASVRVAPPRIADAPASFECRVLHSIETGANQIVILGRVEIAHVRDDLFEDRDRLRIDVPAMRLLARMHGSDWYSRQTDLVRLRRPPRFEPS